MSKKINAILTVLLIATLLLVGLVSCGASRVDYFDYSASNMGWVGNLVLLMHKWIGNYGWTVVVFTLFLKLLMLPIDFWQRYAARKSSVKMKQMQPLVDEIDKRFGANTPRANEEKQKLYKKQGFNMLSSCLPMILSMVIFFVMFGGLNNYSTYSSIESYKTLSNTYYVTMENQFLAMNTDKVEGDKTIAQIYQEEYETRYASRKAYLEKENENKKLSEEAIEQNAELYGRINASNKVRNLLDNNGFASTNKVAIDAVKETYLDQQESWLWIKNVWQPDTWAPVMPTYKDFQGKINMELYPDENSGETTYGVIRQAILEIDGISYGKNGAWNGLMILPFLSIGLSFLSMFLSQQMEKKNRNGNKKDEPKKEKSTQELQQQATNKMMMILMPAMMAVFGFMYTGAFAIYMVVNYTLSIISTVALRWPVEKLVEKNLAKADKDKKNGKASYMR